MRRRGLAVVMVLAIVGGALVAATAPAGGQTAPRGYVSVIFGRTQWVTTGTVGGVPCTPLAGAVTLGTTHDALAARGLTATGVVIPPRTPATGFDCFNGYVLHPGWDLLETWHGEGWRFVSGGTHADVTTLSYEESIAETCGWLSTFAAHGMDASGLFAYGNNTWTTAAQTDPTSRCFAYGRRYWAFSANARSALTAPWMQKTHSVNGGNCNDNTQPCFNFSAPYRYHSPVQLASMMAAAPDTWFAVQFYRLVQGKGGSGIWTWDCTSTDWRRHWTSRGELYCYDDFLRVMDALQTAVASGTVVAADPSTVAAAWGRVLDPTAHPRATTASVSCPEGPSTVCLVTVRDAADGIPSAPLGSVSFASDGAGTFETPTCALAGDRPTTTCTVRYTAAGPPGLQQITATYDGDADHAGAVAVATYNPTGDVTPPTVQITYPSGTTVPRRTTVTVAANATDASGIEHVRFVIGNQLKCTDTVAPFSCPWNTPPAGKTIQIRITARDPFGNEATATVSVRTV